MNAFLDDLRKVIPNYNRNQVSKDRVSKDIAAALLIGLVIGSTIGISGVIGITVVVAFYYNRNLLFGH